MHLTLHGLEMPLLDGRAGVSLVLLRVVCSCLRVLLGVMHGPDGDGRLVVLVGDGRWACDLVVSENWRRRSGVCGVRCGRLEVARGVVGCRGLRGPADRWSRHMVAAKRVVGGSRNLWNAARGGVRRRPGNGSRLDGRSWRWWRCRLRWW